ncbi:ABC transporter substrate-binding protein, partial [Rhizobiaceae sp. 2RAB30]
MRNILLTTCAVLALAFAQGGVALAKDNKIVVGADVDAGTLDPRLTRDTTAARVADLVYAGLVHITPALQPVPDLAESWENPDPQTFVFKLRPNLTFSD